MSVLKYVTFVYTPRNQNKFRTGTGFLQVPRTLGIAESVAAAMESYMGFAKCMYGVIERKLGRVT